MNHHTATEPAARLRRLAWNLVIAAGAILWAALAFLP